MTDRIVRQVREFPFRSGSGGQTDPYSMDAVRPDREVVPLLLNLQVEYSESEGAFTLLVSTVHGELLGDWLHHSLDGALEQALNDFGVTEDRWPRAF